MIRLPLGLGVSLIAAVVVASRAQAQKSIQELSDKERATLSNYLRAHPRYQFLTEDHFDRQTLRYLRADHKSLRPYYLVGDFNRDGKRDFAVVVGKRGGMRVEDERSSMLLIFNGAAKCYRLVHTDHQPFESNDYLALESHTICWLTDASDAGIYIIWRHGRYIYKPMPDLH